MREQEAVAPAPRDRAGKRRRSRDRAGRGRSGGSRRAPRGRPPTSAPPPRARSPRCAAPRGAAPRRWARRAPRPPAGSDRGSGSPSRRRRAAGSRCSTCSTRLTFSKNSDQSSAAQKRRLVMALPTETCPIAWAWCSVRIASSAVIPCSVRRASTSARTGDTRGPYSRIRCSRRTTKAVPSSRGSGAGGAGSDDLVQVAISLQARSRGPRGSPRQGAAGFRSGRA